MRSLTVRVTSDPEDILEMAVQLVLDLFAPVPPEPFPDRPGQTFARSTVPVPTGYVVFDCETTGTDTRRDEIVSLALIQLGADGAERVRYTRLVRPTREIPPEATAVHGISAADVADAPMFSDIATELRSLFGDAVFVAHNVGFDLPMLQRAFERAGVEYLPDKTACTLEAFRLLEPLADNHRLQSICERREIALEGAHEALSDVLATAELLRVVLAEGIAPETIELDTSAYMRLRSKGDTRPASEPQIRRLFGMARSAGLRLPDGSADRDEIVALVHRVVGTSDVDTLTRAEVQDVYDALQELIDQQHTLGHAASA